MEQNKSETVTSREKVRMQQRIHINGDASSGKSTSFEKKVENGQNVEETTISNQSKEHMENKGPAITDAGSNPGDISLSKNICLEESEAGQTVEVTALPYESPRKRSKKRHSSTSITDTKCNPNNISSTTAILMSSADPSLLSGYVENTDGTGTSHDLPKDGRVVNLLKECLDSEFGSRVNDIKDAISAPVSAKMNQSAAYSKEEKISVSSSLLDQSRVSFEQKNMKLPSVIGKAAERSKRKLLILDVNGLLADILPYYAEGYKPDMWISRKAVFKRPFCDEFLQFCFETFNVGIWSSRNRRNVNGVIDFLMGDKKSDLLFCWNQDHCTNTGYKTVGNEFKPLFLKEIKKLWDKEEPDLPWEKGDYNESNTLLIDDSPHKALCNPPYTGIFPEPFTYKDITDKSLGPDGDLRLYLQRLAAAENVQKFVKENPIGQRPITKSNLSWVFYSKIIDATGASEQEKKNGDGTGKRC